VIFRVSNLYDDYQANIEYCVFGCEVGNNGNHHIQFYIHFQNRTYRTAIVNMFLGVHLPHPHLDVCFGSVQENIDYCKKDNMFIEFGEPHVHANVTKREKAIQLMENVGLQAAIKMDAPLMMSCSYPILKELDSLRENPLREGDGPHQLIWWFGPSGSGKSFSAQAYVKNLHNGRCNTKFNQVCKFWSSWDKDVSVAWIDNVTLTHKSHFLEIIGIAGEAPYQVEVKGGMYFCHTSTLLITSIFPPAVLYQQMRPEERVGTTWLELRRRITTLFECNPDDFGSEQVDVDTGLLPENIDMNAVVPEHW
jgi:hypothetical protein